MDGDNQGHRRDEVLDQSEDVRDPADDSGEADDPTALADTYPDAFDGNVEQAQAGVAAHDSTDDRRLITSRSTANDPAQTGNRLRHD